MDYMFSVESSKRKSYHESWNYNNSTLSFSLELYTPSAISFPTFVSFQILMNVISIFTTVAIMPTVSTQTGRLFAIVVMDFLETE